jgi:hypothetical protein
MSTPEILFGQAFPSLLSICKDMPPQVKVAFSWNPSNYTSRFMYMKSLEKKVLNGTMSELESEYILTNLWIKKEQMVRTYMRILLNKWIQKKYGTRFLNTEDPCTLSKPNKAISVFDYKSRGVYNFEANSLRTLFETSLLYTEWMFPIPSHPKNPLTNIQFHEGQRLTIINELRKHGYGSWSIEAYKHCKWNLRVFALDNSTQIKIHSINEMVKNPNDDTKEFLIDFIIEQYEENEINYAPYKAILRWAVKHKLSDPYMVLWLKLMRDYYVIKYRYNINYTNIDDNKLNIIYVRSMNLFENTQKLNEFRNELRSSSQYQPAPLPPPQEDPPEAHPQPQLPQHIVPHSTVVYFQTLDEVLDNILNQTHAIVQQYGQNNGTHDVYDDDDL